MTIEAGSPAYPEIKHYPFLDDPRVDAEQYQAQQGETLDMLAGKVLEFLNDFFEVHAALRHMSADDQGELYRGVAIMMANCYGNGIQVGMQVQEELEQKQRVSRSSKNVRPKREDGLTRRQVGSQNGAAAKNGSSAKRSELTDEQIRTGLRIDAAVHLV